MVRRQVFTFAVLLILTAPAAADILFLKGGGRVEGVVREDGNRLVIENLLGRVIVKKNQVVDRIRSPYVTEWYDDRVKRLDAGSVEEQFRLHEWCLRHGLKRRGARHLDAVLTLDPDHAKARAVRGDVKEEGVWMTPEQAFDARMVKAGFVRVKDRWFTEEGHSAWLRAQQDRMLLLERAARRKQEYEEILLRRREQEERVKLLAAERQAIEQVLEEARKGRAERERLSKENEELKVLVRDLLRERERERAMDLYEWTAWPHYVVTPGFSGFGRGFSRHRSGYDRGGRGMLEFRYRRGHFDLQGRVR